MEELAKKRRGSAPGEREGIRSVCLDPEKIRSMCAAPYLVRRR